jgi:hypothetical protein
MTYIFKHCQVGKGLLSNNKLHKIQTKILCLYGNSCKEQLIDTRCRICHTRMTHTRLLNEE